MQFGVVCLVVHLLLPSLLVATAVYEKTFVEYKIMKMKHFASKYHPHVVPCKNGIEMGFDQPHYIPTWAFHQCPRGSQAIWNLTHQFDTQIVACCLPDTPYANFRTVHYRGGDGVVPVKKIVSDMNITSALNTAFPKILETRSHVRQRRDIPTNVRTGEPPSNWAMIGFIALGLFIGQIVVLTVVCVVVRTTVGRIELDVPEDWDFALPLAESKKPVTEKAATTPTDRGSTGRGSHHPSRSLMMSDNMASDLMSMSMGV